MPADALGSDPISPGDDESFRRLVAQIEARTRFQGRFYKEKCLRRRVTVRLRARGLATFEDYAALLEADPEEYDRLLDVLTINVSKFFRDPATWDAIEREVVPRLFGGREPLCRIWSAGSASGEEPYTVSILLRQWAEQHGRIDELERFRIVGTDIDRRSLDVARGAEYQAMALLETTPATRERCFSPGPPYRLDPELRRNVEFVHRDLISGEPEPEQMLILCRNVIIYLERTIQERLFQRFYDALLPGGFLVLGRVETLLGAARSRFRPVSHRHRIYRKPA